MFVGVCGYGATGSSAVVGLLKEYPELMVCDKAEIQEAFKVDGLQDLEYHLVKQYSRHISGDAAIVRFKKSITYYKTPVVKKTIPPQMYIKAANKFVDGENRGDVELFDESYCGYINSNTLRAGYPESKRCGEALCQAYKKQKNLDVVIPRFTRSYGPTMLKTDTKAISQFIKKAVAGENIVLKSAGTQYYSYTYVADAVSGFLTVLLKGESGEAYNIADESSDIMLKDLAKIIADFAGKEVVFELPDETEKAGYSKATKARLDGSKLKKLGWNARYDIKQGLVRTLKMLMEMD